jgi:hypothetical protein
MQSEQLKKELMIANFGMLILQRRFKQGLAEPD